MNGLVFLIILLICLLAVLSISGALLAPLTVFICIDCGGKWMVTTGPMFDFECPDCDGEMYATMEMPIHTLAQKVSRQQAGDSR